MAHQVGMPAPNFHNHESSFKSQDCLTYHEGFFFIFNVCLFNKCNSRWVFSFLSCVLHWSMAFQQSLALGMPFFLNLMKAETFLVTYLKILLLRKTNKCQCKGHKRETCQFWLMSNSSNDWDHSQMNLEQLLCCMHKYFLGIICWYLLSWVCGSMPVCLFSECRA